MMIVSVLHVEISICTLYVFAGKIKHFIPFNQILSEKTPLNCNPQHMGTGHFVRIEKRREASLPRLFALYFRPVGESRTEHCSPLTAGRGNI